MVKFLRFAAMGVSQNSIAFSCGCAQSTASDVLRAARAHQLPRPLPEEMDDAAIRAVIYPKESRKSRGKAAIGHESVASELMRRGMTMSLLWDECCDAAIARGEEPCMHSAFCRERRDWAQRRDVRMRIERRAAEAIRVGWVGDAGEAIGPDTGEILKAYVLAACLPCSDCLHAEGFCKTDEEAWIAARAHMFSFFGGSTPILAPDSCRTAITRNAEETLVVSEQHRRMSEHCGCAVVPTRVRKPRDKASVEMGVGVIERRAMMALRKRRPMSFPDFNRAPIAQAMAISSRPFQKREGSRESIFLGQEEPMLIPLPGKPYEMSARKEAAVDFNCRVAFGGAWYSAPFQHVERAVTVAATPRSASVMRDGKRVAIRERALRRGDCRTDPSRMPDAHRDCAERNGGRFRKWAAEIGGSTEKAVDAILSSRKVEQRSCRSCRGVLGLAKAHGKGLLEEACAKALPRTPRLSHKVAKDILAAPEKEREEAGDGDGAYLRGGEHYESFDNDDEPGEDEEQRRTNRPWARCTR
ncbi:MAG: hypothetical protein E6043_01355 [Slackia sp.]|nr:hypothetical protein [Slackia sp.]